MTDLPQCDHRHVVDGRLHCDHEKVHAPNGWINERWCVGCPWVDRPSPHVREVPEKYIRPAIGRGGGGATSRDAAARTAGCGTFLRAVITELRVTMSCFGCASLERRMNAWGVAGCRERLATIVDELEGRLSKIDLVTKIQGRLVAARHGYGVLKSNRDVLTAIVNEAIRRGEASEAEPPSPAHPETHQ